MKKRVANIYRMKFAVSSPPLPPVFLSRREIFPAMGKMREDKSAEGAG